MKSNIIDVTKRGSYMERYKLYVDAMCALKEEADEIVLENGKEVNSNESDNE